MVGLRPPLLLELGRPGAGLVVQVPVEASVSTSPCAVSSPSAWTSVMNSSRPASVCPRLRDAELARLLDRVDRVAAGIGQADHLRARALRLKQERREVRRASGCRTDAEHLTARSFTTSAVSASSEWPKA